MKFYEERNKELLEEIKGNRAIESSNSVKSKSDRKKFHKRCKGLEAITKTQNIEIKSLKEIIESKNKKMKNYEIEIKAFEQQIKRINNDIQEFKITNAVLSEAQQKNIEIENRQQQQKLMKLQN
jgi:predicted  nucleic acid-binding Zn-ribbon protein